MNRDALTVYLGGRQRWIGELVVDVGLHPWRAEPQIDIIRYLARWST